MANMGNKRKKLEEDGDDDGLGRGLLSSDDSSRGFGADGEPTTKKKVDYYGNLLVPEDQDEEAAPE
jgi:hypothetical protein